MQRTHKIKSVLRIISIVLLMINFVNAHVEEKVSNLSHYSFKQKIHDLCSGHGLMHLKPLEIQKICNLFADNSTDITSLQQAAVSDKFLSQLTGLIIYSNLPKEKKQKMLRESYDISLDKSQEGNDWGFTIGILIEETNILSVEELTRHTQSSNEYLKSVSKRYLQKKLNHKPNNKLDKPSGNKTIREKQLPENTVRPKLNTKPETIAHKGMSTEMGKNRLMKSNTIPEEESNLNDDTSERHILPMIVRGVCIGIVFLFLISWKRTKYKNK